MKKIFSLFAAVLFAGSMMADKFALVDDMANLAPGDKIILVSESEDYALSTTQNTNNRAAVAVTVTKGVIEAGADVQVITLEASGENLKLKVGDNQYLYAASSSSNHLKTANAETAGDNGVWAISNVKDTVTLVAQGSNSRNVLHFNPNNGSPMFSCYASTSSVKALVKIFKLDGGSTPDPDPQPTGCKWDEIAFLGNGSGNAAYTDRFKVCAGDPAPTSIVNIQSSFGTEPGIYVTFPMPTFGNISLEEGQYAIQGTGMLLYISAFLYDAEKEVTIVCDNKTYTLTVKNANPEAAPVTPISLTEFLTAKPTEEVTLKDLTVIFANGKNTYVIDEDGVALVIYDASKTYYDGTLTAGKVLSGQKATYTSYKNQDEIIPTNAVEATDGVAPVPTELTAAPTDANVNRYISYKNVAAAAKDGKYYIFENVQLYGATGSLKPTEDGNYDLEGLYIVYDGKTPEIIVTGIKASTATALDNTDATVFC